MQRHLTGRCSACAEQDEFDAKTAFDQLTKKYTQLGEVLAAYMAEAGLERAERVDNALALAEKVERIVGGRDVPEGGFPECCLVGQRFANGAEDWFCTGVLIHPQVVLTAAHCHVAGQIEPNVVALNAVDINRLGRAELITVRRTFVHRDFAPPTRRNNDIAVLILSEAARVDPVPIVTSAELSLATETTLAGFGRNHPSLNLGFGIKREVRVPISHLRREATDNLDAAEIELRFESDLEFVAGGAGFDSCNGDSGGPAYILVNGQRKVAGLTSRGTPALQPCGEGGIYTRVDVQRDFIRSAMETANLRLD